MSLKSQRCHFLVRMELLKKNTFKVGTVYKRFLRWKLGLINNSPTKKIPIVKKPIIVYSLRYCSVTNKTKYTYEYINHLCKHFTSPVPLQSVIKFARLMFSAKLTKNLTACAHKQTPKHLLIADSLITEKPQ